MHTDEIESDSWIQSCLQMRHAEYQLAQGVGFSTPTLVVAGVLVAQMTAPDRRRCRQTTSFKAQTRYCGLNSMSLVVITISLYQRALNCSFTSRPGEQGNVFSSVADDIQLFNTRWVHVEFGSH